LDPTLFFVICAVAAGIGYAVKGTTMAPYLRRFTLAFMVVFLMLSIGNCLLHPTSWCPAPMHIDAQGICQQ
jgi:hypothetical protein